MEQDLKKQNETNNTTQEKAKQANQKQESPNTTKSVARKNASEDGENNGQQQSIPQELESELQRAGYSEVKVIPRSYVVSAKDPEGNPSVMLIGPYAFEAVTFYKSSASQGS